MPEPTSITEIVTPEATPDKTTVDSPAPAVENVAAKVEAPAQEKSVINVAQKEALFDEDMGIIPDLKAKIAQDDENARKHLNALQNNENGALAKLLRPLGESDEVAVAAAKKLINEAVASPVAAQEEPKPVVVKAAEPAPVIAQAQIVAPAPEVKAEPQPAKKTVVPEWTLGSVPSKPVKEAAAKEQAAAPAPASRVAANPAPAPVAEPIVARRNVASPAPVRPAPAYVAAPYSYDILARPTPAPVRSPIAEGIIAAKAEKSSVKTPTPKPIYFRDKNVCKNTVPCKATTAKPKNDEVTEQLGLYIKELTETSKTLSSLLILAKLPNKKSDVLFDILIHLMIQVTLDKWNKTVDKINDLAKSAGYNIENTSSNNSTPNTKTSSDATNKSCASEMVEGSKQESIYTPPTLRAY